MRIPLALLATTLLLVACTTAPATEDPSIATSSSSEPTQGSGAEMETRNVSYEGTVKPAGISIYQQGTHRLLLPDGRFILLESSSVDLNGYVDERVMVQGSIRPTVEAGGVIMRVDNIALLEPRNGASSLSSSMESSVTVSSIASSTPPTTASSKPGVSQTQSSTADVASSTPPIIERETLSPEVEARTKTMEKDKTTADQWTQQYCTGHIGFCVPVHRNWYYKSFGTTTSALWHVEMSSEDIASVYAGPIQVDLYPGSVSAKKATDGQVRVQGSEVVGFREWTENRHFEISAPASLEAAVGYITVHVSQYTEQ
ncbi:MAG: hypothetical protein PHH13_00275 [Candidatus Peribacteraceae bacterium]|nr:hypothetical protein [Candidatus Peribacteraceae bacterium]